MNSLVATARCFDDALLQHFADTVASIKAQPRWDKVELVNLFNEMIPDFAHKETGKYLAARM